MKKSPFRALVPGSHCRSAHRPGPLSSEYFYNDGGNISIVVDPSMIGTLPNQAGGLYRFLKTLRLIVV